MPALSLPPPASLKKTQLGFWLSAMTNSAADLPPCDPEMTTALACALLMCAIESSKNNCDLTPITQLSMQGVQSVLIGFRHIFWLLNPIVLRLFWEG